MSTTIPQESATAGIEAALLRMRRNTAAKEDQIRPAFAAAPESIICEKHPAQYLLRDWEETVYQTIRHGEFRLTYARCPVCDAEDEADRVRRFWAKRGVPARVLDATIQNFVTRGDPAKQSAKAEVKAFIARAKAGKGGFFVLIGTPGIGKGHLSAGILKELRGGRFTTHPDMMTDLRATYGTNAGETKKFIDGLKETSCLVLDEMIDTKAGSDEAALMYQVFAYRYENRLPTVITSNEDWPTLKQRLGSRILDRMAEDYKVIVLEGESYRRKKAA